MIANLSKVVREFRMRGAMRANTGPVETNSTKAPSVVVVAERSRAWAEEFCKRLARMRDGDS